ncbi:MAG: hypothetical protein JO257_13355 [Deltaproteobacteria bacterium]|nr:hypothetical protein [Deltaproteobacteria bacterium]
MRNLFVVALFASGCAVSTVGGSRGVTRAEYAGGAKVMFTNASPAKMCELRLSSDGQPEYGDNWLPAAGLASGASLELHVRPGTYKAMWSTCPSGTKDGYYAATLWHDTAFEVSSDVQLYAYVADGVAPTKRAPVLGVDYTVVRFQGQAIGPIVAANAHPQREEAQSEPVAAAPVPAAKLGAAAFIDPAAAKKAHGGKAKRPSLARSRDMASGTVAYRAR